MNAVNIVITSEMFWAKDGHKTQCSLLSNFLCNDPTLQLQSVLTQVTEGELEQNLAKYGVLLIYGQLLFCCPGTDKTAASRNLTSETS